MIRFDRTLLMHTGLDALGRSAGESVLDHFSEMLKLRVGARLAELVSPTDLRRLELHLSAGNLPIAAAWLDANVPQHRLIAIQEFASLIAEIATQAPTILAIEATVAANRAIYAMEFDALDRKK